MVPIIRVGSRNCRHLHLYDGHKQTQMRLLLFLRHLAFAFRLVHRKTDVQQCKSLARGGYAHLCKSEAGAAILIHTGWADGRTSAIVAVRRRSAGVQPTSSTSKLQI